ncbi:alpha/beta hydrolase [Streptomyces sp. NPDC050315]|uniref:alpha/beta fold hydrolase n=1 Tax=Streptomyces sp. NPDC050315 TaxID=3155039 RepID=UPI003447B351
MHFVSVPVSNGESRVEYLVDGSGPGVVLVHGTGAEPEANFAPLIAELRERYTVVAPVLSGSGATTDPGGPLSLDDFVAQTLGAAQAAGLEHYHLVGHSLGASVAAAAAAHAPERVSSLVVHAGWARTDSWMAFQFDLWLRMLRTEPDLLARLIQLTAMSPQALRLSSAPQLEESAKGFSQLFDATGMARQIEVDLQLDITDRLHRISSPTLVIAGTHDVIVPPHHQSELAELIPHAQLVTLDCGHGLPFEDPQLFVKTVTAHLQAHTPRTS